MTNFLSFSDHLDINEMLNISFTEKEMDNLDKLTKEIILSENYEETYALYEGETWQKMKDTFKRNPDESTFKKILKYYAVAWVGDRAGSSIGTEIGKKVIKEPQLGKNYVKDTILGFEKRNSFSSKGAFIGILLMVLVLSIYRKSTDKCAAKKNTPINWWRCQKEAAEHTKSKLMEHSQESLAALKKGKDNEKQIADLKEKVDSKMEYLDEKIAKCEAKIKHLS